MPSASSIAWREAARSCPSAPPPAPAVASWTCSSRVKSFSWCERIASSFSSSSCSPGFSARALISRTANDEQVDRRRRSRSSLASLDRRSRSEASERYSSWKRAARRLGAPVPVEQAAVLVEVEQALVLVLAVHVEQQRRELGEVRAGHRRRTG